MEHTQKDQHQSSRKSIYYIDDVRGMKKIGGKLWV